MIAQTPVRTVAPTETPITVGELKEHVRQTGDDENDTLSAMIDAATAYLDGYSGVLGRCLVTQTWAQSFDGFPDGDDLRLPFPDVAAVTVTYRDDADVLQTLSASSYRLAADALGSKVALDDDATWPTTAIRPDAVTVTMTAGYGAASAVPAILKHAVKTLAAAMYEGREGQMTGSPAFDMWIAPFRRAGM